MLANPPETSIGPINPASAYSPSLSCAILECRGRSSLRSNGKTVRNLFRRLDRDLDSQIILEVLCDRHKIKSWAFVRRSRSSGPETELMKLKASRPGNFVRAASGVAVVHVKQYLAEPDQISALILFFRSLSRSWNWKSSTLCGAVG